MMPTTIPPIPLWDQESPQSRWPFTNMTLQNSNWLILENLIFMSLKLHSRRYFFWFVSICKSNQEVEKKNPNDGSFSVKNIENLSTQHYDNVNAA